MSLRHLMVDLYRAVELKDTEGIREILSNNPELLTNPDCNKNELSPLWIAMLDGHEDIVELLIREFGADPDEKCNIKTKMNINLPMKLKKIFSANQEYYGFTFIQYVSSCSHDYLKKYLSSKIKVLEVLIRNGADINSALSYSNLEPMAIKKDDDEEEQESDDGEDKEEEQENEDEEEQENEDEEEQENEDEEEQEHDDEEESEDEEEQEHDDEEEDTQRHPNLMNALQMALADTYSGDLQFIEFLLRNGADLKRADKCGESPAAYAFAYKDRTNCKKLLLLLIKYGLDLSFVNKLGQSILHFFLSRENWANNVVEISEILLDAGVPLNGSDNNGYTALHLAVKKRHPGLIPFLLKRGANVNTRCVEFGSTPLMSAASADSPDAEIIVYLLLANGAEINAKNYVGRTALHEACLRENEPVINFLIRKGANLSPVDINGWTPFACLVLEINDHKPSYEACKIAMLKEFAKLGLEKLWSSVDLNLIRPNRKLKIPLRSCVREIIHMKKTVFYPPYSYYSVLKMSKNLKKLANLTKNAEFVEKFESNLSYTFYKNDLQWIFDEAMQIRDRSIIVDFRLTRIFGDIFPELIIEKFAENLTVEDLPIE